MSSQFTPEMRDRQARGKNPHASTERSGLAGSQKRDAQMDNNRPMQLGQIPRVETLEEKEKKAYAMSVLEDYEKLIMCAQSSGESIARERLKFEAMLCGLDPES